jgi:TldD protein
MEEKLLRILERYPYADARIERGSKTSIKLADGEVDTVTGNSFGVSVRVLLNGSWGFAHSNDENVDLERLANRAEKLALLSKGKRKLAPLKLKSGRADALSRDPLDKSVEEKLGLLKEAAKHVQGPRIKNRILALSDEVAETIFLNSESVEIRQENCHVYLNCSAVAKKGELIQRGSDRCARVDGYRRITFIESAEEAGASVERLLDASAPPAGRMTAVLDPEMTGVFSHEALGHASEADAVVEKESMLQGMKGKRIGNELVTIFDDPTVCDFGHYVFDDEGVEAKKAVLVDKGILRGYLNSRENCDEVGVAANGHGRAEDYTHVPIVRMGNTYFQPGKSSHSDVFDVKDGIYLKGMRGGSVDIFAGGFMFKAEEAYEIKNGELGRMFRDTAISGNILETMKNVEVVGKDFGTSPGFCGKGGQSVPVSDGGPHVRVRNVKIG